METEPQPAAHPLPRRRRRAVALGLVIAAVVGGWFGLWHYHLKRFAEIRPGVYYRSGQPSKLGLKLLHYLYGVHTVVSAQTFDPQLRTGPIDPGKPSGPRETVFTHELGMQHVQWPMGTEANWPFPTPWQFEEFFKLMDDPANHPVVVHCAGGKHRTGSLSALFRLEYDRWPVERTLAEMYHFDFGDLQPTQELNLRTYVRRPWPSDSQLAVLCDAVCGDEPEAPRSDYAALVRWLRARRDDEPIAARLEALFDRDVPFAVCLAQRLVDEPGDRLAAAATRLASRRLSDPAAPEEEWAMAAALVADFGAPQEQAALETLYKEEAGSRAGPITPRYQALVRGLTNRYTPNRIAWLRPLLDDLRLRPEPDGGGRRFCDTAVVRLAVITNTGLNFNEASQFSWDLGVQQAHAWFDAHPEAIELSQLVPPTGKNEVSQVAVPLPRNIQRVPR